MPMKLLLCALLLAASPQLMADEGWFLTGSYLDVGDASTTLFTEAAPPVEVTTSSYGFALGAGYQFPGGWTLSAQWLATRQDVDASIILPGPNLFYAGSRSKNGFIVTATLPIFTKY